MLSFPFFALAHSRKSSACEHLTLVSFTQQPSDLHSFNLLFTFFSRSEVSPKQRCSRPNSLSSVSCISSMPLGWLPRAPTNSGAAINSVRYDRARVSPRRRFRSFMFDRQSVQTVTVTHTVAPGQPSPNKGNAPPPPAVTTPPGKVNLNNGGTTSVVKNTNTSSNPAQTNTKNVNKNGNGGNNNTNTSTVGIKTGNVDVGVQTSSVNANPSSTNVSPPASTGTSDPNTSLSKRFLDRKTFPS